MADIDTTRTFVDGDTVNAAGLNNIIDQAVIQPAFISAKAPITPSVDPANDYVVIFDASTTSLKKVLPNNIPGVASVAVVSHIPNTNVTPSGAQAGPAVALDINQTTVPGNSFLCGAPGGSTALPFYRAIVPKDLAIPFVNITAWNIDWSLGNYFYKQIMVTVPAATFTFSGGFDGQSIIVELSQGGASNNVAWPTARWENGTVPVLSPGAGRIDLFQFWYLGGIVLAKRILTNAF